MGPRSKMAVQPEVAYRAGPRSRLQMLNPSLTQPPPPPLPPGPEPETPAAYRAGPRSRLQILNPSLLLSNPPPPPPPPPLPADEPHQVSHITSYPTIQKLSYNSILLFFKNFSNGKYSQKISLVNKSKTGRLGFLREIV